MNLCDTNMEVLIHIDLQYYCGPDTKRTLK